MPSILIFGLGYSAQVIAAHLRARGWQVAATGSAGNLAFTDHPAVTQAIARSTHILSSVPPAGDTDPVLTTYGAAIAAHPAWRGYLSSTGVYGDTAGAWVDETAPLLGRRPARIAADRAWQALGAHIFRLPGIYGPGRSVLDRIAQSRAHRVDVPGQVFSRIHVDDIATGVLADIDAPIPPTIWNLADDLPVAQNTVVEAACTLLNAPLPPLRPLSQSGLPPVALDFYAENRRVANGRAKRLLGWRPIWPTYVDGLRGILAGAGKG